MNTYAIISVGGKQYRVSEGQTLLVDRLKHGAGKTFEPKVLLIGGGDGGTDLSPSATVTASVVADVKGVFEVETHETELLVAKLAVT